MSSDRRQALPRQIGRQGEGGQKERAKATDKKKREEEEGEKKELPVDTQQHTQEIVLIHILFPGGGIHGRVWVRPDLLPISLSLGFSTLDFCQAFVLNFFTSFKSFVPRSVSNGRGLCSVPVPMLSDCENIEGKESEREDDVCIPSHSQAKLCCSLTECLSRQLTYPILSPNYVAFSVYRFISQNIRRIYLFLFNVFCLYFRPRL